MTGTVYMYTLRESIHRRMGLVLLGTAGLLTGLYLWQISFDTGPLGHPLVRLGQIVVPAEMFVKTNFDSLLGLSANLWLLLALFAGAPLLTSYLDKGWADMLMSKGVPRWQVALERYAATLTLFIVTMFLVNGVIGLYVWWGTGLTPWKFFGAVALLILSFAAILAMLMVISIGQNNAALLMMVGFLQWMLSVLLAGREKNIYLFLKAEWARFILDWMYRILPKNSDLRDMGTALLRDTPIESWFPVWSTAVFLVVCLVAACVLLHRKSF